MVLVAQSGGEVLGVIAWWLISMLVAVILGGAILRLACRFASVNVPVLTRAMFITVITIAVSWAVDLVIVMPVQALTSDPSLDVNPPELMAQAASFIATTIATFYIYKAMIPVATLGRAALVWIIQLLIVLGIVAIVVGVITLLKIAT